MKVNTVMVRVEGKYRPMDHENRAWKANNLLEQQGHGDYPAL